MAILARSSLLLMGFWLVRKINFAVDGVAAVIIGIAVAVSAVKTVAEQAKNLING